MSVSRIPLLHLFFFGALLCQSVIVFAQQETSDTTTGVIETIDTSEYLPLLYDYSLDYNLMLAASKGYVSEIDRLIEKGADINTTTEEGATPLIFAVTNNKLAAVNELLKFNPVIDKITSSYETSLIIAAKNGNTDICETLIRAGADPDLPDRNGATPIHHAALNGFFDIVDLLIYYNASLDQKSDEGLTPLLVSIMSGYADITDLLIQNGANIEARNNDGFTPFLMATVNGDTLIMDLLFRHGADIYAINNSNYNALDLTISANQSEAARYLLRIGNKWTNTETDVVNPYVVASKYRRKEMINLLKENNVQGQVKYAIDQASFTVSERLVFRDYYTGLGLSFKEPFLNAGIIAGCDMKLWYSRVLKKDSEHTFYQYFDKGYLVYAGIFKDFKLHENPLKSNIAISAALSAGYSFGHILKGTYLTPSNQFILIPDISMKWNRENYYLLAGLEYIKSPFYHIGPLWVRIGISYTLFFDKVRTQVKPIKWY
jgi:ankyrin repeat protein